MPPFDRCAILHQKRYHVTVDSSFGYPYKYMKKVIVVGGGIIGLFSAYELHKNDCEVTVIDRQRFGQESSWAGGGIVSPLYPWRYPDTITQPSTLSQKIYPTIINEMQQATGLDAEFLPSGMLVAGDYSDQNPQAWAEQNNINMQLVDQAAIKHLAPEIADHYQNGYWFPEVHQVRNPRLVSVAVAYLKHRKVKLIENEPVTQILTQSDQTAGVKTTKATYSADAVVIAGGAWTSGIIDEQPVGRPVRPIKGQMLLLKGEPGAVRRITLSEDRYIIPRKDGRILVGSTTEDVGFDKSATAEVKQQLHEYAINTIPSLTRYEIEHHWAGLRPASSDEIPVIGEHPKIRNLFINSGHYRNGVVMAPASVRLLAEIMLHKTTSLQAQNYSP
jgi:glycine oxidase